MKVSNEIKDRTTEIIATIFDSNDTFFYFKKHVELLSLTKSK